MVKSTPDNPWTIRGSKRIYDNPWIDVTEYDVLNPAGNPNIYGVVHFKNQAVGVVPIQDGHIWLVGQYRFALGAYSWEIPEGGSPEGQTTLETAHRELREEAGLVAKTMTPLLSMHLSNSVCDEYADVFLATDLSVVDPDPEDTEEIGIIRIPLSEFFERVESGDITDAITVAAAYKLMVMDARGMLNL